MAPSARVTPSPVAGLAQLFDRVELRPDAPVALGDAVRRDDAWRVAAFRGYADHMETPEFAAALARLAEAAAERPTAILCAEALPQRCHRRLIADVLAARGHEVVHLLALGRAEPHALHPDARVLPDGRLLYAAAEPAGIFEVG